ncbi:hypothetical protein U9M48_042647 [Paspalum notatum var. saurae]|uniref:Reverse transcriptase zinc-binding domain-containing protein n=1 Tax=Paspalum notatum var. saurae TaxID=547442 RepID=A0AAQ3XEQ8_PASNO
MGNQLVTTGWLVQSNRVDRPIWVNDLIDGTTCAWDEQKLTTFFTPMDREVISNIPICTRTQEDFWAWHYEKSGIFSVRSAYHIEGLMRNFWWGNNNGKQRICWVAWDEIIKPNHLGDFWAWHYEKSGIFSVRPAYPMLVHMRERRTAWLDNRAGRSNTRAEENEWIALWKVIVPEKIRVFVWRLAHRSIPTGDVLKRWNMAQ